MQVYPSGSGDLGERRTRSRRLDDALGKKSLTEKQFKVFYFLCSHIDKIGLPPSVREIADHFSISIKAAHDYLKSLSKKEYIRLFPGTARGVEILKKDISEWNEFIEECDMNLEPMKDEILEVPLLGSIAAGTPILAQENIHSILLVPQSLVSENYKGILFALRVKGDSMQDGGIIDGDFAILKQVIDYKSEVKNGDIIAAILDGDATLKRYNKINGKLQLLPDNSKYNPINIAESDIISIAGKLVALYRKY